MKKNILFAALVLALAAVLAVWGAAQRGGAGAARVDVTDGGTYIIALDKDGIYTIEDARLPVTLEVKDGRIRFVNSVCPDHLCEGFGWLNREYDQAVCMPAGVVVSVEGRSE